MAAKNGVIITSGAIRGTGVNSGYQAGTQIFSSGGGLVPFAYGDAGVDFTVSKLGIVSLTFNDTYTYTATYDDGHDFKPSTNDALRTNNISITVPPGYSNTGGDPVTGTETFTQEAVALPTVIMVDIDNEMDFGSSYRVTLNGEITDDGGLVVEAAGFYVYKGDSNNPSFIQQNGTEQTQSGTTGTFDTTYSTTSSDTLFSVVAYARNSSLGTALSSNVIKFTSAVLVGPYTQTSWTQSGGYVTIASDGDVTVILGSAQSYTGFGNTGTHDTCGANTVATSGTVKSPITGYSNNNTDIPISTSASRDSTKGTYSFGSYDGTVSVSQGGVASVPAANAKRITNVSQSPTGANNGAESRPVTVSFTVTASSAFCNEDSTFPGSKTVQQPGIPPTPTTLDISPNALTFSSAAQTADPKPSWTQSGGTSGVGITLTSTLPSWITSAAGESSTQEITITVLKNETTSSRSNTISWQTLDGFASDSITVTQNAPTNNDATTGSINGGDDITVTFNTTSVDLAILSDGDWTIAEGNERATSVAGWTLERLSGSGNASIAFNGNNNTSGMERSGQLILTSTSGTVLDTITFTQRYEGDTN